MPVVNPGIRRYIGSAIQRLFNSASFSAPLTHSLTLERGTGSPTFTRATTGTFQDNEGVLRTAIAGEARFTGARRVENLIRLGAAQSSTLAIGASVTMTLPAGTYIFSQGVSVGTATFSGTGGATGTLAASASVRTSVVKTITAGTLIVTGSVAILTDIQVENITGRTDQTTPSEYVSVGVLSAPYHGAGVDGVEFFDTDLDGNALPTTQAYDYVQLNGTAGTYLSTPDSAANSITGDIDIRWYGSLADWTPTAANYALVAKNSGTGNRTFIFWVQPTGELIFQVSSDGTAVSTATSSASTGIADGATKWVRVTRASASGNVNFYTSDDGSTWSLVGLADRTTTAGSLFDSAAALEVGAYGVGSTYPASGKFYQAKIYNGIDGTLAVDFDASRYAGGTTLTGSTGETWTLNGSAWVHPSNSPMKGYLSEPAATNLCLQSGNLAHASWLDSVSGTGSAPTRTANVAVAPDGTMTATQLFITLNGGNALGDVAGLHQVPTTGAGTYTGGLWLKGAVGGEVILIRHVAGVAYSQATLTTEWQRFSHSEVRATDNFEVVLRGSLGSSNSATFYAWGAQLELGSSATSYIPTTTVAVTRNADVDSLPTAGNILAAAGTIALTYTPTSAPSGTRFLWGTYVDASNYTAIMHDATNLIFRKRIAGVNTDATIANAFVSGTAYKICASWGAAGQTIYLNGTAGTPHANTSSAQVAATMQFGADGNSLQQPGMSIGNARIWLTQKSGSEQSAITI